MNKAVLASLLTAAVSVGTGSLFGQARAQQGAHVFVPGSSQERPGDRGQRAHTNHVIHVRPMATGTAPAGETPASIRPVYGLPADVTYGGSGTIALVVAYDYPTAAADLDTFSRAFGLPRVCSQSGYASGCFNFSVKYASGYQPAADCGWAQEAALDIEWAHALAPHANIVLVEAGSSSFSSLFNAVTVAANSVGAYGEVSMSWGGSEFWSEAYYDNRFVKSGVVFFAASGDTGGVTMYPAVSPNVIAAGGTRINRDYTGKFLSETAWSGTGGGASAYEPRPGYQGIISNITGSRRGVPDLSFDADPASGVSVYDSTACQGYSGWMVFGGTSVAAPSLAGIVNSAGHFFPSTAAELSTIYQNLGNGTVFRDITSGTAGSNAAGPGWDYVTGVGSNQGLNGK